MDLLCLILAYQDIGDLLRFPILASNDRFAAVRSQVRGYPIRGYLVESSTKAGELLRGPSVISAAQLCARAIFVRNVEYFLFIAARTVALDFWFCLESGIPEIQAKALATFRYRSDRRREGGNHNDLPSIPWTERLENVVRSLPTEEENLELGGYLQVPLPGPNAVNPEYYIGFCLKRLNGRECVEEIPELTKMHRALFPRVTPGSPSYHIVIGVSIRSRYLTPIIPDLANPLEPTTKFAVGYASYEALKIIVTSGTVNTSLETYVTTARTNSFRERARNILLDKGLLAKLPDKVVRWYRCVVYGEHYPDLDNVSVDLGYITSPSQVPYGIRTLSVYPSSLQGITNRDPRSFILTLQNAGTDISDGHHLSRDAYRRGEYIEPSFEEPERPIPKAPDGEYERILAYLKGEAETWM